MLMIENFYLTFCMFVYIVFDVCVLHVRMCMLHVHVSDVCVRVPCMCVACVCLMYVTYVGDY